MYVELEYTSPGGLCLAVDCAKTNLGSEPEAHAQQIQTLLLSAKTKDTTATPLTVRINSTLTFDDILTALWEDARSNGLFRYVFARKKLSSKILTGKYQFIAQLNPDRAIKRRKPQKIHNLNQPFNPTDFHFSKANPQETILHMKPITTKVNDKSSDDHAILINVSPLEYGHILLVPFISQNQPQRITLQGLQLAVELLLLSRSCDFRVGFSSLCGYASVNHHHYHAYYLDHRLFIEYAELKHVAGPCLEIVHYPVPCFAFSLKTSATMGADIANFIENVFKLTSYLQDNNIAHNLYMTRGSSAGRKGHFDSLRIFIWARSSSYGAKNNIAFNLGLCELGGHFPIKNQQAYASITEEIVCQKLTEICEPFKNIRPAIISLFDGSSGGGVG